MFSQVKKNESALERITRYQGEMQIHPRRWKSIKLKETKNADKWKPIKFQKKKKEIFQKKKREQQK